MNNVFLEPIIHLGEQSAVLCSEISQFHNWKNTEFVTGVDRSKTLELEDSY